MYFDERSDTVSVSSHGSRGSTEFETGPDGHDGGWRSMLMLQFQTQFSSTIAFSIIASFIIVSEEAAYIIGTPKAMLPPPNYKHGTIRLLYAFDVVYFIDILLMIIYKRVEWPDVKCKYAERADILLVLEFCSVIPFDGIYYTLTTMQANLKVLYLLRLRYIARMFRLLLFYKTSNKYVGVNPYLHMFLTLIILVIFTISIASVTYIIECTLVQNCGYHNSVYYKRLCYVVLTRVNAMGSIVHHYFESSNIVFFTGLLVIIFNIYLMCNFYCDVILVIEEKFALIAHYERLKIRVLANPYIGTVRATRYVKIIQAVYSLFWTKKKGLTQRDIISEYLPEIKYKEILLDISWNPLKHTHLFRNEDVAFLRHLSTLMKHTYLSPGEPIYKKDEYKSKMIYIISGVVEILSEDDNETPIMSFTDGTCLGESSLIVDYKSTSSVICKDYCEVVILRKKHFIKLSKIYPDKMRGFLERVTDRYRYANQFKVLTHLQIPDKSKHEEMNMKWLKYILRKLLSLEIKTDNRYLLDELESLVFCTKYLDMLVIAQEFKMVTDSVFLKNTFPYILQPTSVLLTGWNRFITIIFILFAIVYLYIIAISPEIPDTYVLFHVLVSILWYVDVYVDMSTAVTTGQGFLLTIADILYQRTQSYTFLLNVASAFSPGLFMLLMHPNSSRKLIITTDCNKLLKIYKIEQFFDSIKFSSTSKMAALVYIKFSFYLIFILYYSSGFLAMMISFDDVSGKSLEEFSKRFDLDTPSEVLLFNMYIVIHFLCNFQKPLDYMYHLSELLFLQSVYLPFSAVFTAYRTAADALQMYDVLNMSDYSKKMHIVLQTFKMKHLYDDVIHDCIKLQYRIDGVNFLYGEYHVYKQLSKNLFRIIRTGYLQRNIEQMPLFHLLDRKIISDVACKMERYLICENTIVVLEGDTCQEMHLIYSGYCEITSKNGKSLLGPGDTISTFEFCTRLPSFNTVTAVTYCQIISLTWDHYNRITLAHPDFHESMKAAIEPFKNLQREAKDISSWRRKKETRKDWIVFKKDSEYFSVFPFWASGLKYFLMPVTFTTYGRFVRYWEIFRCIFAVSTAILTPINLITKEQIPTSEYVFLFAVNLTAWVDLYVRHHIIYYNEDFIPVSHPYFTATNYWNRAFAVDLIACLPIDLVYQMNTGHSSVPIVLGVNKFLQMYRLHGVIAYYTGFKMTQIKIIAMVKYLVLAVLVISVSTAIHFHHVCDYGEHKALTCRSASITVSLNNNHTMVEYKMYAYCLFFITSMFTNSFYTFDEIREPLEKRLLIILGLAGYLFWAYVSSSIIAVNLSRNFNLITYQEALKDLVTFMGIRRIDKRLKIEVIAHFEYIWRRAHGIDLHQTLTTFSSAYQRNLLYDVFGLKLLQSSIFSLANESVIRDLLLIAKHEMILRNGIIYRVNDVHNKLHFVYKGKVEIIGPDGNHMNILPEGSVCGSLDDVERSRQTITATAYGHVELLTFPSIKFHETLSKYPIAYKQFVKHSAVHVDFIENVEDVELNKFRKARKKPTTTLQKQYWWIRPWKAILIVVSALSFFLETYQIATFDHSTAVVFFLYIFDIVYVAKILLQFNTPYLNEFGIIVQNKNLIAKRYKKRGWWYDLFSVVPIELVGALLLAYNHNHFTIVWSYLRANRCIRIGYSIVSMKKAASKLNTNAFWARTLYNTFSCIVCQIIIASLLLAVDNTQLKLDQKTSWENLTYFFYYWKLLLNMMTKMLITYDLSMITISSAFALTLAMLLSKCVIINYVAQIVCTTQVVNRNKNLYKIYATKLMEYVTIEKLSYPIIKKNTEYINSLWSHDKGVQFPKLLEEAPYYLKEGILNSLFGVHLRKHEIFSECHIDLVRQVSACFVTRKFFPGDIITYIDDVDHCMYFIHTGEVQMLSEDTLSRENVEGVLSSGEMFGFEQGIYSRIGHEYTYKAIENTLVLVLKREDWIHLLDFFPASKHYLYDKDKDV